jgi:hypothetical protein
MAVTALLQVIAGIIGIIAYFPLIVGIIRNKIEQSFAAFLLWGMIDTIATITTVLEKGNFWLPLANAVGSCIVTTLLAIKKQISWTWIETMTAFLVAVCLLVWYTTGEIAGIISSSLAVVVASVPQMVATYKTPATTPTGSYVIFLTANIMSFVAGKSWTIEERFYAGCSVFLCLVIVVFSLRQSKK